MNRRQRPMWQAIRGNGKRATVVPTTVTQSLSAGKRRSVAVRVVDVFGNDASAAVQVET